MELKKKILIVCKAFYPENSPRAHRATELAKEFAGQGHEVTVLTLKKPEIHSTFEKEYNLTIKDLGTPRWRSPDFGKSKIGYFLTRVFFRLLSLGFEYPEIELSFKVKKALRNEGGYDLLISIAVPYPIHWGVAWAWRKNQTIARTWVADCGDPYMGDTLDSFRHWFYFKYVEKWFMRKADFITIPIESGKNGYYPEFHSKIRIIPQGSKIEIIPETENNKSNPVLAFAYAGSFIPGMRDPRAFLEYLTTLKTDFRFFLFTNNRGLIEPYILKLNGKLIVSDYIPRNELLPKLAVMDFLVNFDNNVPFNLPSKLIDYAIVKRPVLNVTKTPDKKIIAEFLSRNYDNAMPLKDIESYKIENVCASILKLVDG